jgi:REP element-mobilizing transposase RayT
MRLSDYDYRQPGAYFVTLVTHERECLFGNIRDGAMECNPYGDIARTCWQAIPEHFPRVECDVFVIMPNHVHGIVWLKGDPDPAGDPPERQFGRPIAGSLSTIIRVYKSVVTRAINERRETPGGKVWQTRFHDHIIRNERELVAIQEYIMNNPARWSEDRINPANVDNPRGG